MIISRPCLHPDCPPRDGYIRGQYESVEFIREIPKKPKLISSSTTDLSKIARSETRTLEQEDLLRKAERVVKGSAEVLPNGETLTPAAADGIVKEGRKRGKTISFAQSRGPSAKDETLAQDDETNPVEWIMITRSDPGGSVPRFMVERGTPGGIVSDAGKFLDWACKKEHAEDEVESVETGDNDHTKEKPRKELEAFDTNGHLAGLDGPSEDVEPAAITVQEGAGLPIAPIQEAHQQGGLLSTVAGVAYASIENHAPQAVIDRLPGHQHSLSMSSVPENDPIPNGTGSTPLSPVESESTSVASFASAEDHFDGNDAVSNKSATSQTKSSNSKDAENLSPHEKELLKLNRRKTLLNEKLAKAREKETKDKEELTSKEEERVRKAQEKHAKEIQKQEEKYKKEVAKLEAKRAREAAKLEDRKKKAGDKDEKARLTREKEEMRQELEMVSKERDILRDQVGALQRENASLAVRLGKMEEGKGVLMDVKSESEGGRSRSSSLRRMGMAMGEKGKEATVLGGEKKEGVEAMK